jgi:hypothetical protein
VDRKLDSAISVVKSTEDGQRNNGTVALKRSMDWSVLVQRAMNPRFIIVASVGSQEPTRHENNQVASCTKSESEPKLRAE